MSDKLEKQKLLLLLKEQEERKNSKSIYKYYPESGAYARSGYTKHLEFFEAGKKHRQRLMLAANRVGKTESVGGYEVALHLTGLYPDWWNGRRLTHPPKIWACGDTSKTVREILQQKLLGNPGQWGSGLIPKNKIVKIARGSGVADSVEIVYCKHTSGQISQLIFKSYEQDRESFQGSEPDIIWLDEECPLNIYTECLLRTMTNNGLLLLTFTPLRGLTELILSLLPGGDVNEIDNNTSNCYIVTATWDDAPHLTEEVKKELLASIPPYQRDARSKGIPQLGSGAIYPVPESDILVDDFQIPEYFEKVYALDVGWNKTAAVFAAIDRETQTTYIYSEYYRGEAEPIVHAQAIKSRGDWIPGVIDPAARGRGQKDGEQLLKIYKEDLNLELITANNAVEAGIYNTWQLLSSGKLKVFKSCKNWINEYRLYRRDERGNIVKKQDHLMDATRYLVMTGLDIARNNIQKPDSDTHTHNFIQHGWMG